MGTTIFSETELIDFLAGEGFKETSKNNFLKETEVLDYHVWYAPHNETHTITLGFHCFGKTTRKAPISCVEGFIAHSLDDVKFILPRMLFYNRRNPC
jgi:hypothetical protein